MKKIIFSTALILLGMGFANAQKTDKNQENTFFTRKVNDISYEIDIIIKKNKEQLKKELNDIEKKLENNELTKAEADSTRIAKAEFYARQIEDETKLQEDRIKELINEKIENNIHFSSDMSTYQKKLIEKKVLVSAEYAFGHSMILADGKSNHEYYSSNVLSSFGAELGTKTRLGKETSNWYWKSMIGSDAHSFKLSNGKTFESVNNETILVDLDFPVKRSRMNVLNFKLSNYIEYDFSKPKFDDFGNPIIRSRQSFYVGAGFFLGYSQISRSLVYEKNGEEYKENTQAKFNTNHFIYGVSAYVGYKNFSLRGTYNLNPIFKRSFADQNILNVALVLELL